MKRHFTFIILFFVISFPSLTRATGPRSVNNQGLPVKWMNQPIEVDLESDSDVRGKNVEPLVDEALSEWSAVSEAAVSFQINDLGSVIDGTNVCEFLFDVITCPNGPLEDGTNPLVIDEDGSIVADFFGNAARFTTLGFASIVGSDSATGGAIKGEAVFNAACLEGVTIEPGCGNVGLSFSDDDFVSFIVHEMGHFLGLDHSQVNLIESSDLDSSNNHLITTMYPRFLVGNGINFKTPERDDHVGLAQLYPSNSFSSLTWSIEGRILSASGNEEVQCANIVARNVLIPETDAISALSGDFDPAGTNSGDFVIRGLIPGESYTLDIEPIDSSAIGASGYTPCRGTGGEPKPPQFTSFTSSQSFSGSAGSVLELDCRIGDDCVPSVDDPQGTGNVKGVASGCSLVR